MKKPPDKYKTLKVPLKGIVKGTIDYANLHSSIRRANKLVIHVYQFLRLWILKKYHNKQTIPEIDEGLIQMAFKALSTESVGPKPKGANLKTYVDFCSFYDNVYRKLGYKNKIDATNLSQIIGYLCTDMLTNIENNIKLHFLNYVRRFVNSSFKKQHSEILEEYKGKEKIEMNKKLRKELYVLKQDLLNNTKNIDKKYHKWLLKYKSKILPSKTKDSFHADINDNPQQFLKYMICMNLELEKLESKMFQFFPLRTELKPHYIPIDTKSIVEIFDIKNKQKYLEDIDGTKKELWDKYFNTQNKIFKKKGYVFDSRILTDGYAVSIQFIHEDEYIKEKQKKENLKKGKKKMKELCKDLTSKQIENVKEKLKQTKKEEGKQKRKLLREKFKKLSKIEQQKIKNLKKKKYVEFPYLDEISEEELNTVKKSLKVYNDPGKRDLLYMMDDNGNILRYSNSQRMHDTKRLKYQRLISNYRNKNKITKKEIELTNYNSKSCYLTKFQKYIKMKNNINSQLLKQYEANIFRQYKWYSYINTQRAESKMIEKIKETFGENCKILYGDWQGNQLTNFISTPNIGIKRKVAEHFSVYNFDEFRTSCLNHKTEERCENLHLLDKNGKSRKLHSVLTYKMENNRYGCINRDLNSVKNMKKISDHWFQHKERPLRYRRDFDLETNKLKGSNPLR